MLIKLRRKIRSSRFKIFVLLALSINLNVGNQAEAMAATSVIELCHLVRLGYAIAQFYTQQKLISAMPAIEAFDYSSGHLLTLADMVGFQNAYAQLPVPYINQPIFKMAQSILAPSVNSTSTDKSMGHMLAIKQYELLEKKCGTEQNIALLRDLNMTTKPVTYAELSAPSLAKAAHARIPYIWSSHYDQHVKKEQQWLVQSIAHGVTLISPARNVMISGQLKIQGPTQAQIEYVNQWQAMMREALRNPEQLQRYKKLVMHQTMHVLETMQKLKSEKLYERVLALYNILKMQVGDATDIFDAGMRDFVQDILKGYVKNNGEIDPVAILNRNNYSQKYYREFVQKFSPLVKDIDYQKYWIEAQDMPGIGTYQTAHSRWRSYPDFAKAMTHDKLYLHRIELINHCLNNEFDKAKMILNAYTDDPIMKGVYDELYADYSARIVLMQKNIAEYCEKLFDANGFYKAYHDNPAFAALSDAQRHEISSSKEKLESFNMALLEQAQIKEELMKRFDIPSSAPQEVHQACYQLVNDGSWLQVEPILIDRISELSQNKEEVAKAFFAPNGVLKIFEQLPQAKQLPIIKDMHTNAYADMRKLINHLLFLENGMPGTPIAGKCAEALKDYSIYAPTQSDKAKKYMHVALSKILHPHSDKRSSMAHKKIQEVEAPKIPVKSAYPKIKAGIFGLSLLASMIAAQPHLSVSNKCGNEFEITDPKKASICPEIKHEELGSLCADLPIDHGGEIEKGICGDGNSYENKVIPLLPLCEVGITPQEKNDCNYAQQTIPGLGNAQIISQTPNPDTRNNDKGHIAAEHTPLAIDVQDDIAKKVPDKAIASQKKATTFNLECSPELKVRLKEIIKQHAHKNSGQECAIHKVKTSGGMHILDLKELSGFELVEKEWEKLSKVYDGAITIAHPNNPTEKYPLWIDYAHFLDPVITINCKKDEMKLNGFHHDYLDQARKKGLIKLKITNLYDNGVYEGKWSYQNAEPKFSTFFPSEWSRAEVMEKIFQAVKAQIDDVVIINKRKWKLVGKSLDGIPIEMIFEVVKPNEHECSVMLITAYPAMDYYGKK